MNILILEIMFLKNRQEWWVKQIKNLKISDLKILNKIWKQNKMNICRIKLLISKCRETIRVLKYKVYKIKIT
jgi:hypothetical protein